MNLQALFDSLPLWAIFLITLVSVGTLIEVGFRLGARAHGRPRHEGEPQVTLVVSSVLGLVAFMLGFTLGLAENRYESRRESKFSEADAISTAYHRAVLLPDSSRIAVRRLLRRAATVGPELGGESSEKAVTSLEVIRDSLWQIASSEAKANPQSETVALFLESVGEVFDVFEREVFVARHGRIPVTIWAVLLALMMLGVGLMGYQSGLSGARRPKSAMTSLALALATVVYVIADLDRPHAGTLRLGREAMAELHRAFTPDSRHADSSLRR